jgi:hypothetical protein
MQGLPSSALRELRGLALDFADYPCFFFLLNFTWRSTQEPLFGNFLPDLKQLVLFRADFTPEALRAFVANFAFPPISLSSTNFFSHIKAIGATVLVLADEEPHFLPQLEALAGRLPEDLRAAVVYCRDDPAPCHNLVLKIGGGPQLMLYNPLKKLNWYYRGPMEERGILEWVAHVRAGRVRAAGPGAGFRGFVGNLFDIARAHGPIGIGLFVALLFVFVMVFVLGIAQTVRDKRRARVHKFQ